jgi:flagellar L-ring protein precursor FlgH
MAVAFCCTVLLVLGACAHNAPRDAATGKGMPEKMHPVQPSDSLVKSTEAPPTGSLWTRTSGSMFDDNKARQVGDILTITVAEESEAANQANTNTSRGNSYTGSLGVPGLTVNGKKMLNPTNFSFDASMNSQFDGSGTTNRANTMSAVMTATVVEVLPNGNLYIRGSRWTKVNNELQQIVLEGVVRPMDVTRSNTVLSQNIADARIYFVGEGQVSRKQKPGWLGQLIDVLSPL